MDLKLNGKLAVISGSTSGIGKSIAHTLATEGARVIINGRSQESVDRTLADLQLGDQAVGIPADISTAEGCESLIQQAAKIAPVDILINNAGIFEPWPFEEISDADWQRFFNINVMSGIRLSRAVTQTMKERGWGRIIFIASESAINIPVEMIHYGMTKTAQLSVSRGLAKSLARTGVTVNSVLPGPTWSEGVQDFVKELAGDRDIEAFKENFFSESRPGSLIARFGQTEEVAAMVAFLCSEIAATTTGAAMRCEGGLVDTCF